ncbi:MAG: FAD-dependent oxidoreductase [Deltaproteobacteria bacterium]|nr:FAD-dependent oxidoreductase [Deltaproteobacteria bacterium]
MPFRTATLRAARDLTPWVRELTLDPGPGFSFVPGQWVSLRMPREGHPDPLARSYSIASEPREDGCFELAVTRVEGGPGSAFLHALKVGDSLTITHAQGFFTMPDPLPRPVLLVATGTGLCPLRSMLRARLAAGDPTRFTLLLGVRTEEDLLYREELQGLARTHPNVRFEPTLSRPAGAWAGRTGYVQTHFPALVSELGLCDAYVCGLTGMIKEARRVLKEALGFPRERIHTERYD